MSSFPHSPQELKALQEATQVAEDLAKKRQELLNKNREAAKVHLLAMQILISKRALPR
jgi:hypothetical protein